MNSSLQTGNDRSLHSTTPATATQTGTDSILEQHKTALAEVTETLEKNEKELLATTDELGHAQARVKQLTAKIRELKSATKDAKRDKAWHEVSIKRRMPTAEKPALTDEKLNEILGVISSEKPGPISHDDLLAIVKERCSAFRLIGVSKKLRKCIKQHQGFEDQGNDQYSVKARG